MSLFCDLKTNVPLSSALNGPITQLTVHSTTAVAMKRAHKPKIDEWKAGKEDAMF